MMVVDIFVDLALVTMNVSVDYDDGRWLPKALGGAGYKLPHLMITCTSSDRNRYRQRDRLTSRPHSSEVGRIGKGYRIE